MPIGWIGAVFDAQPVFIQRGVPAQLAGGRVQFIHCAGNYLAFGVLPGAAADAVARIDEVAVAQFGGLRAQVGMPDVVARANGLRQGLAVLVGTGQTTEVAAPTRACAGHKKGHVLGARGQVGTGHQSSQAGDCQPACLYVHTHHVTPSKGDKYGLGGLWPSFEICVCSRAIRRLCAIGWWYKKPCMILQPAVVK